MRLLKIGGASSAFIAALHLAIIFVGAPAYRYFGAGEQMARLDETGSLGPALVTAGLTVVFALWAAYAFSGAGLLRRLPLLRTGLVVIGAIYTARGLLFGPQLVWFLSGFRDAVPPRQLVFSAVSLLTGLCYLAGARQQWERLRPGAGR